MKRFLLNGIFSAATVLFAVMFSLTGAHAVDVTKTMDKTKAVAKSTVPGAKVDINSASQAELEKLPGVGAVSAKKIIAARPYGSPADLLKAGLSARVVEKITPLVSVGPNPAASRAIAPKAEMPKAAAPAAPTRSKAVKQVQPPPVKQVQAPPADSGMVWVNPDSKIFHKSGSKWYGRTKQGSYMTEAEAIKAGYRESKQGGAK